MVISQESHGNNAACYGGYGDNHATDDEKYELGGYGGDETDAEQDENAGNVTAHSDEAGNAARSKCWGLSFAPPS